MKSWVTGPLGTVAEIANGKTPSKSDQRTFGHPVLKIRDVDEFGEFRGPMESCVEAAFAERNSEKILQLGDALILNAAHNADYVASKTYRVGPAAIGALATGEWLIVRPKSGHLDAGFAHHWINSVRTRKALRDLVKGIHLYPKDVARLPIPLPPLPEQRRIAAILDQAEALRAKRRQAIARLDALTQSIFIEMFGDPVTLPARWTHATLGSRLDFLTSGSRGWARYYAPKGASFLRVQNVGCDEMKLEDVAYVTPPESAEAKRTRVQAGDVLLSITADLGRTGVVPASLSGAFVNQHLAILRPSRLNARFLSAYLSSAVGQSSIRRLNRNGVKAGLNFDDIRSLTIPLPPEDLQQDFERLASAVDRLSTRAGTCRARLDALFASLGHRAFRGEL